MRSPEPDETRAEVARRRLAQLAAAFDAEAPPAEPAAPTRAAASPRPPRFSAAHLRVLGVAGVAALVLLGWMLLSGRPEASEPVEPLALSPSSAPSSAGSSAGPPGQPAELVVDVVGEVRDPGIVTVPRGSRVYEAIEAAGGLSGPKVDTSGVNLARVLEDGEQVVVGPAAAQAGPASGGGGGAAGPAGKVSLNTATLEQLDTLPGVGPVTAQAILAWREENGRFSAVEDLLDVKGIGDATFGELHDLVTL